MSSVQEKHFLRLIKFSYDLSLKVTRTFIKTNILHSHNDSFVDFLNFYKHELYHLWNNDTRCCACSSNLLLPQNRELNKEQFIKLYDIQGTRTRGHFKTGTGKKVQQHCICGIHCITSCSLNDLDIILIHTIVRKCVKLSADDNMWLQTIREIRNNLAHAVSTTCFDQGRLDKWWSKLEGSVLGLAGKVPPLDCYAESIEDQIKLLRKTDLDITDLKECLSQMTMDNETILSKLEQQTEDVKQKSEEIKEEIIHHLDQNKEEMLIDIKNLRFEVKTHGLQQQVSGTADKKSVPQSQDSETCYVEWRVITPNEWQVELIKQKLDLLKSLLQGWFKLEFVYVGSLVIETSVQKHVLADDNLLIPAVRSFLEILVVVCKIDTETAATVRINLSVLPHLRKDNLYRMKRKQILRDRRKHPTEFPLVCDLCPERRFRSEVDIQQHKRMALRHTSAYSQFPTTTKTLQQYIDSDLQTNDPYRSVCNGVVKSIGNILKNNVSPKYRPAEGGLAGKGTAIRGSSDLDLVFLLPQSYGTMEKFQSDLENILDDIQDTLNCCGYRIVGRSTKALQIQVECNEPGTGHRRTIDVDLLPALNLNRYSSAELFDKMSEMAADERIFFTPSLTKKQRDFVSDRPEHVKRLIRYVKDWQNKNIQDSPSSYAMELLIIHLWKQSGQPESFTFDNAVGAVMKALASYKDLRVEFDDFYDKSMRQRHSAPYIIDPVNPYSNVMAGYNHWQEVADEAKKYIRHDLSNPVCTGFFSN